MSTCAIYGCPNPPSATNAYCEKHKSFHKPAVVVKGAQKAIIPKSAPPKKASGYCVEYATKKGTSARLCQHKKCFKAINAPVMQLGKLYKDDDDTSWFHLACLFAHMEENRAILPPISMKKIFGLEVLTATDKDALSALVKMEVAARKLLDEQRANETYMEKETEKKFWAISVSGTTTVTRWGPIGEAGFDTTKELGSEAAAREWKKKKIAEKEAGGYCRIMKIDDGESDSEEDTKTTKKQQKKKKAESESEEEETTKKTKPPAKKKKKEESEEEEEEQIPKTKKPVAKKKKEESEEEEEEIPKKKTTKKPLVKKKEESEEEEEQEPKKKQPTKSVSKTKAKAKESSEEEEESKKPKSKTKKKRPVSDSEEEEEEAPKKPKKKKAMCPYGKECWYIKDAEHCLNLSH